jgi:RNA polymerase sigma-70 factor, ECF subfamily
MPLSASHDSILEARFASHYALPHSIGKPMADLYRRVEEKYCQFFRNKPDYDVRKLLMWTITKSKGEGATSECALTFGQLSVLADEELLAHLDHGHGDAVAVLYQRYRRLVFGVAYRVLHDRGEAEDIVQNVFVDLYKTSLRFDPARGTAKIWILQFAYSRSFRRKRQLSCRHFYSTVEISEAEDTLPVAASPADTVEASYAVSAALATLGEPQRQVVQLASEGHTLRDIAERTGETLANVRHHYYRGLTKLRTHFGVTHAGSARTRKEAADATT